MRNLKIALGTAQFGMNYGITNKKGQVSAETVQKILKIAKKHGIEYLDTAKAYGNNEDIVGNNIPVHSKFKIISKLKPQNKKSYTRQDEDMWELELNESLRKLKVERIDTMMIHNTRDFTTKGSERLVQWLENIKKIGLTKKTGISIYKKEELEYVDLKKIDVVQLPCSIYDQRMITNGTTKFLREKEISIHARSLYLQGLLVTKSSDWPETINKKFLEHHKNFELYAKKNQCGLVELAIEWAKNQEWIDVAIIGVTNENEIRQLIKGWKNNKLYRGGKETEWKWTIPDDLDPRLWGNKT